MGLSENQMLLDELNVFYNDLKEYQQLLESGETPQRKDDLRESLVRRSGKLKPVVVGLTQKQYGEQFGRRFDVWNQALDAGSYPPSRNWALSALIDSVNEAIGRLEAQPQRGELLMGAVTFGPPRVFVAHGGDSDALDKMCEFFSALAIDLLIAEKQPSEGRSINAQVEWCLDQADCAIVLATKGDIDGRTGDFIPRGEHTHRSWKMPRKTVKQNSLFVGGGGSIPFKHKREGLGAFQSGQF